MKLTHKIKIEWAREGNVVKATGYLDGEKKKVLYYPIIEDSLAKTINAKAEIAEKMIAPRRIIPVRMANTGQRMSFETFCRLRELEGERHF